jgi:hypothetical protein
MKARNIIIFVSLLIGSASAADSVGNDFTTVYLSHLADEPRPTEQRLYTDLYIWGGEDQDVYLGKLNGSKFDSESIWNKYGKYGNKYSSNSIWNEYGKYGGDYSQYSPFNKYASHPPALRDRNGKFYGYFTINKYKAKRADYDIIDFICEHYESIREDVGEWYEKAIK